MKNLYCSTAVLLATAALNVSYSPAVKAQEGGASDAGFGGMMLDEIIVTANRREENLQDVSASLTVFNQQQLNEANITNPSELATYTPNLAINNRFGSDNTTFAIRGFSQELRTTASVGVYFAEVVALRGANAQQSGDGATPGDLFDLANVQVLKGPQGTLFGRNTTGGAVLLTPQRPTDELEGYVEGSVGNFDMYRGQAVVNVPVTDSFKVRLGVDQIKRDGYIENISAIGPEEFGDQDYVAFRGSALWEITSELENYTIFRYSDSSNNGYPGVIVGCNPAIPLISTLCQTDLDARRASGQDGFYETYNFVDQPVNDQELWQAINTTTWDITDEILIKNIIAYGGIETKQRSAIFGTNWMLGGEQLIFQQVGYNSDVLTTDQETFVEEIQVQGISFDERLVWQVGLYYESSEPGGDYGSVSPALIACDQGSITGTNPADYRCNNLVGIGAIQSIPGGVEYTNQAVYAQASYELSDSFGVTAGLRYTDDETKGEVTDTIYQFAAGSYGAPINSLTEVRKPETSSDEVTWLLGVDYTPTDDLLLYAKYNRGYRQGSVNLAGSPGLDSHDPETVDTYEIGSKWSFNGAVPGTLNAALFYNDFTDQQVQYGYLKAISNVGTTAVVNAGSSTIWGAEVDANLFLTESLTLTAAYAYLNSNVDSVEFPEFPDGSFATEPSTTTAEGEPLSFSPEHSLVTTLAWELPVPIEIGDMLLSATYVYTGEQQAVSEESSAYYKIDDYSLWNLNYMWTSVMGSPIDLSVFVTNVTDEEYYTFIAGLYSVSGLEAGQPGLPRMYGARIRYNFGL
ncbi:TonB-dependent receptor [Mangrovimicrobium sediminis]|uniref:TonB-dependent receptor n=1 Tax=Mangrovimicrobium sediminis TaxID=2562682 RepID=A0A4Z0M2E9_9GAMM|nr:TonB-dependent receptor [Haliea sp. SAOS-164]TGD73548.1 TonB-dependent receptor [Haliea sp. SAOS-164]